MKYVVSCALDVLGARSGDEDFGEVVDGVDICGELLAPADLDGPTMTAGASIADRRSNAKADAGADRSRRMFTAATSSV